MVCDYKAGLHIDLKKMADSFKVSRVLLTAVELGIFEIIGQQTYTAKDVSARLGTNERATAILLNALSTLGLLAKRQDSYENEPVITQMLSKASSDSLLASFRHLNNGWERWSALTEIVRTGCPNNNLWSNEMSIDLAMTMQLGAKNLVEQLCLMIDFTDIHSICDMGCGPGAIALALLQTQPHTTAVLIDHDKAALNLARQDVIARGLRERVKIVHQNILTDTMERNFDMVVLSLVLCLFSRQEVIQLLKKVKTILRPGGTLILGEMLLKESRTAPVSGTLFAVQLLVNGSKGELFTLRDIRKILSDCEMSYERHFPMPQYDIIVGKNETI